MKRAWLRLATVLAAVALVCCGQDIAAKRIVILKVDGLESDLLQNAIQKVDPATGKPQLPWLAYIFGKNGTVFENFYTRGISLSAPSWSMLDTGQHTIIRGNVEYDRYTGQAYDYLNFVPFYLGYARKRQVDMPGVEVLDRAGIPLLIDRFPYSQTFQSFQLFQRGVRWTTLEAVLKRRFSGSAILATVESGAGPSYDALIQKQTESELDHSLTDPRVLYLDFFTGDIDHEGHATNDPAALLSALRTLDSLSGRIWSTIQKSPLATQTIFVMVSDHGMNNVPGVSSQTFSLPDLLNSSEGGAHHVVTDRQQLSDYKLKALNPLVSRVITPSTASFYLQGEASHYPTAWLDIDGNERTAVHLRNSDLNKIHILLLQLARADLTATIRRAAAGDLLAIIDRHRTSWTKTINEMAEEMSALSQAIEDRKKLVASEPNKWSEEQHDSGDDKVSRRLRKGLYDKEDEHAAYSRYLDHLHKLLAFHPDPDHPLKEKISELVPPMALGDNNSVAQIQHYVVGLSPLGLTLDANGHLDEERSFRYVDYPALLAKQRARNIPQKQLSPRPIDFTAMSLPDGRYDNRDNNSGAASEHAYWLYGDADSQLVILTDSSGQISVKPVRALKQDESGKVSWTVQAWRAGLPLGLFEDAKLNLPAAADRAAWLSAWHTERDWFKAIHRCRYSNGVIGIIEELSPVAENVPGQPGVGSILLRYERRRRELVQADFHVFAADHWNFNVRFPNPGGNHGSFLRVSTHSVWMMAGAGIPAQHVEEPYDSLNFASTLLKLMGLPPPMPERVVTLTR